MKQSKTLAGILYTVLTVYQMLLMRYILSNTVLTDVPFCMLAEVLLTACFGVLAVRCLARGGEFSMEDKKKLLVGTALYVVFLGVYYQAELTIITYGMMSFNLSSSSMAIPVVLLVVKALLVVAPAVVAVLPEHKQKEVSVSEAEEEQPEQTASADAPQA